MRRSSNLSAILIIGCVVSATLLPLRQAGAQPTQLVNAFPNLTFTNPIFLTHSSDGTNRIFVVQQNGLIRVFPNDSAVASSSVSTFLNIANKLSSPGGEEGLLGLAFHPDYETNGYFYVNYTAPTPLRTVVARYSVQPGNPNKADSLSEYKLLEVNQPYSNHNGGMIFFGLDGYLYISFGDGGSGGDPGDRAQNRGVLLGKLLRIDVDTVTATTNYGIPSDNPLVGNPNGWREEIFAWGLRNPWRGSQDPVSGEIWFGDVGQSAREEINLIETGGNYGWRCYEGNASFNTSGCGPSSNYIFPVKDYDRGQGICVTGGYIYRGYRRPDLVGAYIYADYGSGRIWMLRYANGQLTSDSLLLDSPYAISSFGTDQDGELYICRHSTSGIIYRFAGSPQTGVGPGEGLPAEFRLEQNYPNPFNPSTTINYELPFPSFVTLEVIDVLGRQVVTLVEGVQPAGRHNATLDASKLSSGIYLYRMAAGKFASVKKLLVIK